MKTEMEIFDEIFGTKDCTINDNLNNTKIIDVNAFFQDIKFNRNFIPTDEFTADLDKKIKELEHSDS